MALVTPAALLSYYAHLFPVDAFWAWKSTEGAGATGSCSHSWTFRVPVKDRNSEEGQAFLSQDAKEGVDADKLPVWRDVGFFSASALRSFCLKHIPYRMELGPCYDLDLTRGRDESLPPDMISHIESKEWVFDIDINDYEKGGDNGPALLRTCCPPLSRRVCPKCWPIMEAAVTQLLFFIEHEWRIPRRDCLCVFSGRRGVHVWIRAHKDLRGTVGPSLRKSMLVDRVHLWASPKWASVVQHQPQLMTSILRSFRAWGDAQGYAMQPTFMTKWNQFLHLQEHWSEREPIPSDIWKWVMESIWIRSDVKVTSRWDHLLKAPFSVHPNTGALALPLSLDMDNPTIGYATFDPSLAPSLLDVVSNPSLPTWTQAVELFTRWARGEGEAKSPPLPPPEKQQQSQDEWKLAFEDPELMQMLD